MQRIDLAVIGSGIGGAMTASLLQDRKVVVFEKDQNLGGCASTFRHNNYTYNAGATTFVGYENNHPIKKIFQQADFIPNISSSTIAIRTIQKDRVVDRIQDFEAFLDALNHAYPHSNNRLFWEKMRSIDAKFWQLQNIHYQKHSLRGYLKSSRFVMELLWVFGLDLLVSAETFIDKMLPNISKEYRAFIDAQLLITVQATSKDVSLLSMALGLAYPFHEVFYANGGMGNIVEGLLQNVEVHTKEKIQSIQKGSNRIHLNPIDSMLMLFS
jgi:phytoene dehydrogenase-like protein